VHHNAGSHRCGCTDGSRTPCPGCVRSMG
jgi:hypothetical protein